MNVSLIEQFPASMIESRTEGNVTGLRAEAAIGSCEFSLIRRRAVLDGFKWDPQVGDVETLSAFPLVLKSRVWNTIADQAERLTSELIGATAEILDRPDLIGELGLPRALCRVLGEPAPATPAAGLVMRFDFHTTTEGWRISEVNSDVPGGMSEASCFTAMIADYFPQFQMAGHPANIWSDALAAEAGQGGVVALLSAPGYMEDHQVVAYLADQLRQRACRAYLAKPEQIHWIDESAHLKTKWCGSAVDVIVRFYQAEWMSRLPERYGWKNFFKGGRTRVANPCFAVISESKRFPLVWERLRVKLPTWRALLPETRDPRDAPWARDDGWLLKMAMCNTGDSIRIREFMSPRAWLGTRFAAQGSAGRWVAQRRFEPVPVSTPVGPRYACIGVYTINGLVAGAYARLSEHPVMNFTATDVALLLEDDE